MGAQSSADTASALDNSQSLLVMILHLAEEYAMFSGRDISGISKEDWAREGLTKLLTEQIAENRAFLNEPQTAPEGFVSVELLQIERDTADRLRDENAKLRALTAPQIEKNNRFCAHDDCPWPDCLVDGVCPSQPSSVTRPEGK